MRILKLICLLLYLLLATACIQKSNEPFKQLRSQIINNEIDAEEATSLLIEYFSESKDFENSKQLGFILLYKNPDAYEAYDCLSWIYYRQALDEPENGYDNLILSKSIMESWMCKKGEGESIGTYYFLGLINELIGECEDAHFNYNKYIENVDQDKILSDSKPQEYYEVKEKIKNDLELCQKKLFSPI